MTPDQIKLVQQSFAKVAPISEQAAVLFYDRLFEIAPSVRAMFPNDMTEQRRKLFPIRLCGFETLKAWKCFDADTGKDLGREVREYFIPDFSNWKEHDAFEATFARLLRDLKATEAPPAP